MPKEEDSLTGRSEKDKVKESSAETTVITGDRVYAQSFSLWGAVSEVSHCREVDFTKIVYPGH